MLLEIPWPETPVTVAIIAAAAALVGAWLTWVASGSGRLQNRVDLLEARVVKLEDEKRVLADKLTAATSFINRIGLWIARGRKGPLPTPPVQILEHVDAELWPQDVPVGGTE